MNPAPTLPTGSFVDSRLSGKWQYITTFLDGTQYGSFYTFGSNGYFDYTLIYKGPTGSCISFSQAVAYHQGSYGVVGSISDAANAGKIYLLYTNHTEDSQVANTGNLAHVKTQSRADSRGTATASNGCIVVP